MGYHRAGFTEIVGVDIQPQPRYPFEFVQGDALEYVREFGHLFDAIHASPPCQVFSSKTRDKSKHRDYVGPTRFWLEKSGKLFVIENVIGSPLIQPVTLCGSMFGLRVRRHRLFESNFPLTAPNCRHEWQDADKCFQIYDHGKWFDTGTVHVFGSGGGKGAEYWPDAMDIDWMTRKELAQAIPPAYTEFIGRQLMQHLTGSQLTAAMETTTP
jgi:DNA (cytosine-5)-methyltransferase 1